MLSFPFSLSATFSSHFLPFLGARHDGSALCESLPLGAPKLRNCDCGVGNGGGRCKTATPAPAIIGISGTTRAPANPQNLVPSEPPCLPPPASRPRPHAPHVCISVPRIERVKAHPRHCLMQSWAMARPSFMSHIIATKRETQVEGRPRRITDMARGEIKERPALQTLQRFPSADDPMEAVRCSDCG